MSRRSFTLRRTRRLHHCRAAWWLPELPIWWPYPEHFPRSSGALLISAGTAPPSLPAWCSRCEVDSTSSRIASRAMIEPLSLGLREEETSDGLLSSEDLKEEKGIITIT